MLNPHCYDFQFTIQSIAILWNLKMTESPFGVGEMQHGLQAEQELGIEIIPGTKVMRDTEHIKFIRAKAEGAVLVPQPSSDRHDPLNWSKARKHMVMVISLFFVFGLASGPLSIATQFNSLIQAFNSDLESVVQIVRAKVIPTNTDRLVLRFLSPGSPTFYGYRFPPISDVVRCSYGAQSSA